MLSRLTGDSGVISMPFIFKTTLKLKLIITGWNFSGITIFSLFFYNSTVVQETTTEVFTTVLMKDLIT